jgi:hypothetical protein
MPKREVRCTACGTVNRVPGYSIERIPQMRALPCSAARTWQKNAVEASLRRSLSDSGSFSFTEGRFLILAFLWGFSRSNTQRTHWCGGVDLFGPDTIFSEAEDVFSFERTFTGDGYTTTHWTVELILRPGGNLRTKKITRDAF